MNKPKLKAKDAASLLILSVINDKPHVLMGKRHAAHQFLPNYYVFPGGKLDRSDYNATFSAPLNDNNVALLNTEKRNCSNQYANALALCAIRETAEETGLLIGTHGEQPQKKTSPTVWQIFYQHQLLPNPSALHYFARAITPTGHVRRFDTRFFITFCSNISNIEDMHDSSELLDLQWVDIFTPPSIHMLDITKNIILEAKDCIMPDMALKQCRPISLYYSVKGRHYRKVQCN